MSHRVTLRHAGGDRREIEIAPVASPDPAERARPRD
jgi:hypothetical protein